MNTKTEITNSAKNRVFLNNLSALCSIRNMDMTEAFRAAGLNSDYLEDLKNGGDVTCEILVMLSIYFHIPVDYFFELSVNEKMLDGSVELTPKGPFKFAYKVLCALCDDYKINDVYKEIIEGSCISLPPCFDAPKLKNKIFSGQLNNSDYLSLFYLLSVIEATTIPDDLYGEYNREMEILNERKCNETVNWCNMLRDFKFTHKQFEKIIRYAIKTADIKKLWRDYVRFYEHHIDEIDFRNASSYIANCCPAITDFISYIDNYCNTVDISNADKIINDCFGDEATAVGVCKKYNISIS